MMGHLLCLKNLKKIGLNVSVDVNTVDSNVNPGGHLRGDVTVRHVNVCTSVSSNLHLYRHFICEIISIRPGLQNSVCAVYNTWGFSLLATFTCC